MLFKKKFKMPGRSVLGKKDCKKLFAYLHEKNFNLEGKEENELMNISEENTFIKVPQTKISVYYNHKGNPMFFKVDQHVGNGFSYIPTIYALKQIPNLIPCFTIHPDVSRFILGGADLMTPGIMLSYNDQEVLQPSQFNKGDVFGIRIIGNEIPFAVGVTCLDHIQFQQGRGKALEVFHVYGDALWMTGTDASKILSKGILDMGVESKSSVSEPVTDIQLRKSTDGQAENEDILKKEDIYPLHECDPFSTETEKTKETFDDCVKDVHAFRQEIIDDKTKESCSKPCTETEWPVEVIDTFLELVLLHVLHTTIRDSDCPFDSSGLYSLMGQQASEVPCKIVFNRCLQKKKKDYTEQSLNEEDYILQGSVLCQSVLGFDSEKSYNIPCDVKRSSYRKFNKFLQYYSKDVKILLLRKQRDTESFNIVAIQRQHPLYVSYTKIHQQIVNNSNNQTLHSSTSLKMTLKTPTKNLKSTVHKNEKLQKPDSTLEESWCVIKLYQPNSCGVSIFKESGIVPRYSNKWYDKSQCFEAMDSYIRNHELLVKQEPETNQVLLDSTLKSCVLTRKNRQKMKEDAPIILPYEDVLNQFLSLLSIYHGVFRQISSDSNDFNQDNLRVYQGEMKTIHIKEEKRQGTKCITTIQNLYLFDVDAKRFAELLRQSVAASARVVYAKGTETSKVENALVLIQGSSSMTAIDILTQQFGVPRKYITKA
jgi:predicted RNA-binding protein (TIGR00451 family)